MHAYAQEFNESLLDLAFITSINPFSSDKLLYIHIMAAKHLRECLQSPMSEDQRFQFIVLQDQLLVTVERTYTSGVVTFNKEEHIKNSEDLFDVVKSILDLTKQLKEAEAVERCQPQVVLTGPWPAHECFILTGSIPI